MRLFCFLFIIGCVCNMLSLSAKEISVLNYGAIPDDGLDDSDALREAAAYCRNHPGTTLRIPAGTYRFCDAQAQHIEQDAVSGAYGENVQRRLFQPKVPYVKALDFTGARNLTIEATGATLLLEGWYEVISLVRVRNVCIRGLRILYQRPPSTQGRVCRIDSGFFEMQIDTARYRFLKPVITGRLHFVDGIRNRVYMGGRCGKKQLVAADRIRIYTDRLPALGDYGVLRHSGHYRPAVMINESRDVMLQHVTLFSQPGMGVVGHLSQNILVDGLSVVPEPGTVISTNTDATHFTSCTGTVTLQHCRFAGQGDDCTNIHNYYYTIYPGRSPRQAEIRIEGADLHAQWLDYPSRGDTMAVVSCADLSLKEKFVVQRVDTSYADWNVVVTLDKPLNLTDAKQWYMTNETRRPKVRILNNVSQSHLGRAYLIKSRDVVIAHNSICQSSIAAIKLGAEVSWHESGPVEQVLIEDNWIRDCGYQMGANQPSAIVIESSGCKARPVRTNQHIVIRNNVIQTDKTVLFSVQDASDVSFFHNVIPERTSPIRIGNAEKIQINP